MKSSRNEEGFTRDLTASSSVPPIVQQAASARVRFAKNGRHGILLGRKFILTSTSALPAPSFFSRGRPRYVVEVAGRPIACRLAVLRCSVGLVGLQPLKNSRSDFEAAASQAANVEFGLELERPFRIFVYTASGAWRMGEGRVCGRMAEYETFGHGPMGLDDLGCPMFDEQGRFVDLIC